MKINFETLFNKAKDSLGVLNTKKELVTRLLLLIADANASGISSYELVEGGFIEIGADVRRDRKGTEGITNPSDGSEEALDDLFERTTGEEVDTITEEESEEFDQSDVIDQE